ncbi:MAG TPA: hypothetical protein VK760_02450 [Candidatus Acidoferrales bacterium]|nr:hypothetical protein [Candidatus Acidoferrales bacterium]
MVSAGVLAGCGGSPLPAAAPAQPATSREPGARHRATARFRFKIPRARKTGHGARYVSPSTASIEIAAYDVNHVYLLAKTVQNTVPGTGGCSGISGGTYTCRIVLAVPTGYDSFDVFAFDAKSGTGNKLSAITRFPFDVVAGHANDVAMTLGGIPASLNVSLTGNSIFAAGNATLGFSMGGVGKNAAQHFSIVAKDADGNVIVNPGAPLVSLAADDATQQSIEIASSSPGNFTVTPLAQASAPLAMTASAKPAGGTAFSVHFALKLVPILYEISCWNTTVAAYAPWSTSPILTLTSANGIAANSAMALDASGNLYVANDVATPDGAVLEFAPGSTTASRTIASLDGPTFLALDANGNIFVTESSDVKEFTVAGGSTPSRTLGSGAGLDAPAGLAVDSAGNLYVANSQGTTGISVFAPGTSTVTTFSMNAGMNQPKWPAFDTSGNLYVANYAGHNVTEYAAPISAASAVLHTFGSSMSIDQPQAIAVDTFGNLYVANTSSQSAVEFAANQSIVRTISGIGLDGTNLVDTDQIGNVFLPDENTESIGMYPPGSSTTPSLTYSNGLDGPMDVVVWP